MTNGTTSWRLCSTCKKDIAFNARYYECSVSTCTGLRTGYVFCSVACCEAHMPGARHRDAAAVEKKSPTQSEFAKSQDIVAPNSARRIIPNQVSTGLTTTKKEANEILVVVSKVKAYIKSQADMNVSDDIMEILSHRIRYFCDQAIKEAQADGRKTVQDKDLK